MTNKIYKTAQGQTVDLGAILLKNEHVRAVGNMNVNARGDLLDSSNRVIDQRNQQVARQLESTTQPVPTAVSTKPLHTSTVSARSGSINTMPNTVALRDQPVTAPVATAPAESQLTGLAAAIARSKEQLKPTEEITESNPGVNKL